MPPPHYKQAKDIKLFICVARKCFFPVIFRSFVPVPFHSPSGTPAADGAFHSNWIRLSVAVVAWSLTRSPPMSGTHSIESFHPGQARTAANLFTFTRECSRRMPKGLRCCRGVLLVAVVGRLFCVVVLMRSRHATFYQASKNDLLLLLLSVGRAPHACSVFNWSQCLTFTFPLLHTHPLLLRVEGGQIILAN